MIYRPKHFKLQELIPPDIYQQRGEAAWELLDARLLITLDALRDELGALTVNNWHLGGTYKESGLRSMESTTGASWSQHRFGRAADCKFVITPSETRDYIIANQSLFPYLTTMENVDATPTWLHIDVRNNPSAEIRIVNP